jgi:hypothetical protein
MISKEQIESLATHIAQLIEGIGFDDLQKIPQKFPSPTLRLVQ